MKHLLLIKLGGSLITDKGKDKTAKKDVIGRLAKEIKSAMKGRRERIIIAHGSGSFGHSSAAKYGIKEGLNKKSFAGLPIVAEDAIEINRIVMGEFLKTKLPVVSFAPASLFLARKRKLSKAMTENVFEAMNKGYWPILYGDIVFDSEIGFCIFSSETTLSILAKKALKQKIKVRLIFCGNTDGVYDSQGKTIEKITLKNFKSVKLSITGSDKTDVTGGMIHKVEESLALTKKGITTQIINGQRRGELKKAILGEMIKGTVVGI